MMVEIFMMIIFRIMMTMMTIFMMITIRISHLYYFSVLMRGLAVAAANLSVGEQ